jgi:phage terminase small subunit
MAKKTSLRQQKFAQNYVIDLNGTRAAIAAGYKESSAHEQASRMLNNRNVQAMIAKLQSARASKLELRAEKIDEEVSRLAFSNMLDYIRVQDGDGRIDLSTLTRDQAAAIQEIREDTTGGAGDGERKLVLRTTFKLADKTKNLELLYRRMGLLTDKVQHTGLESIAEAIAKGRKALEE